MGGIEERGSIRRAAMVIVALVLFPSVGEAQCEQGMISSCHAEGESEVAAGNHGHALELFYRGCEQDQRADCVSLIEVAAEHPEARTSVPQLWVLVLARCGERDDVMCGQLGRDVFDDLSDLRANPQAREAVATACARDVADACAGRGVISEARRRGRVDARADFERACRLESGRACRRLAEIVEPSRPAISLQRYTEGCRFGDGVSCGRQGRAIAASDANAAAPLLLRGCEAGDADSCVWLGRMNEQSAFAGASAAAAERVYGLACTGAENPIACGRLGAIVHARGEDQAAEPLLSTACAGRFATACADLGDIYEARNERRRAARFYARARRTLQRECRRGAGDACLYVSEMYRLGRGTRESERRTAVWLGRACAAGAGDPARCLEAGLAIATPRGARRARPILRPLCEAGQARACAALAPIVPRRQREPLYRRACELGETAACEHAPGAQPGTAVASAGTGTSETGTSETGTSETGTSETGTAEVVASVEATSVEPPRPEDDPSLSDAERRAAARTRRRAEREERRLAAERLAAERAVQAAERRATREAAAQQRRSERAERSATRRVARAQTRVEAATVSETAARGRVEAAAEQVTTTEHEVERTAAAEVEATRGLEAIAADADRSEAWRLARRIREEHARAERAAARAVVERRRADRAAAREAAARQRAERALASLAAAQLQARGAGAQATAAERARREARESAARGAQERREAEATERRARRQADAQARAAAEAAETAARQGAAERRAQARAEAARVRTAEREAARGAIAASAAREAERRRQAEASATARREQAREMAARESEAQQEAEAAARARGEAVAIARREAAAREAARETAAQERRRAERAAARETAARERAAAREAEQRRLAEEATAREAEQRRLAEEAGAREAEARREAAERAEEERREALARARAQAAARRRAERAAARAAAARVRAEQAAAREAATREAAQRRETEQRERAEALAAAAAEAQRQATAREAELQRAIETARAREAEARERAAAREAERAEARQARTEAQREARELARAEARTRAEAQRAEREQRLREAAEGREARERDAAEVRGAAEAVATACLGGDADACERAGGMFLAGEGVEANAPRALYYLELACAADRSSACASAMPLVEEGQRAHLARLNGGACRGGDADACERGLSLLDANDESALPLRAALSRRGCELGRAETCVVAAEASRGGHGTRRDRGRAAASYTAACEGDQDEGCRGLTELCHVGMLAACQGLAHASTLAPEGDLFERVAELRASGHDLAAVRILDAARRDAPSPQIAAELGLAYLGAGRPVSAERQLRAATGAEGDDWVWAHREGLRLVLRHVRAALGTVVVHCGAPGAEVRVVDDGPPGACGEPMRIGGGEQRVEVRAFGHRSVTETVEVSAGERGEVSVSLEPYQCDTPGEEHIGGGDGGCCWPGQAWVEGACVGYPECPDGGWVYGTECMSADTPRPGPPRLASFHVGLLGGVTNFARTDTSLFRPDVDALGQATALGPRLELRLGIKLFDLFAVDLTGGGTVQDVASWLDCAPGAPACADRSATAVTLDFGVMLTAHTDPPRLGGNVDFHVGIGVRPWTNIFFEDDADGAQLTATVVPAELGMSIFFADLFSLDFVGQAELWVPWEYCGHGADGASYCLDGDALEYELAWSGLVGFTLHAD